MNHSVFSGVWDTEWGTLSLQIEGLRATGTYGKGGRVEGLVAGYTLRGNWMQPHAAGSGLSWGTMTLSLAGDGRSFTGNWSYTDDNAPGGGSWTGKRRS